MSKEIPYKVHKAILEGIVFEPKFSKPESTIIFSPGLSAHHKDYSNLLEPLGEEFKVIAYNLRGHGNSTGIFDPLDAVTDLEYIISNEEGKVHAVGHSFGATISAVVKNQNIASRFLINPFMSFEVLPKASQCGIHALRILTYTGILCPIDWLLRTGITKRFGLMFNDRQPLRDIGRLVKIKQFEYNKSKPLAWVLSSQDEVLGTNQSRAHYKKLYHFLEKLFPDATNFDQNVRGLNHCLNVTPYDFEPFLKSERNKHNERMIEDISNFFRKYS